MATFTTKIMKVGAPNSNGRTYTKEAIEEAIKQYQAKDHPNLGTLNFTNTIDLDKVSHTINNLRIHNDTLIGEITPLNTPCGNILSEILPFTSFRLACSILAKNIHVGEDGIKTITDCQFISISAVIFNPEDPL